MGSTSTSFLHDYYRGGKIPVVTVCSKDPVLLFDDIKDYTKGNGTNIAYTSLDTPIALQIDYMLKLIPNLQNIAILYDVKNTSAVQTQVLPLKAQSGAYKLTCYDVAVQDPKRAKEELSRLIPAMVQTLKNSDPELKRSIFWITGSTSVFNEMETINRYADKVPVLSVVADVITDSKYKALLSIGVSFSNNALIAALYCIRVITGEVKAGDLPVGVVSPPDIAINFNKARELGLRIPFEFFESAAFICDYEGVLVRDKGQKIKP
jgi:putative ABC transport system substrate-binding protein